MIIDQQLLILHWQDQDGYGKGLEAFASREALCHWLKLAMAGTPKEEKQRILADCASSLEADGAVEWEFNGTRDSEEPTLEGTHFMVHRRHVIG